jgi:hypothetical protein
MGIFRDPATRHHDVDEEHACLSSQDGQPLVSFRRHTSACSYWHFGSLDTVLLNYTTSKPYCVHIHVCTSDTELHRAPTTVMRITVPAFPILAWGP